MRVFGPVPSRRLGRSLGINNIPPKICTYSCIYCQLGRSVKMTADRAEFYAPSELFAEVQEKIINARAHNEPIDYLTIVPDGEPTLDRNLGRLLALLKTFNIKLAVITNASLIDDQEVRSALRQADWVSLKIDAVDENVWRAIDRPHGRLSLNRILNGIKDFAREFSGELTTETMLVRNVNDDAGHVEAMAEFIRSLAPEAAYLAVPTRPPAESWVAPPEEHVLNASFQIFYERGLNVEYLLGYEGNKFAYTGNVREDILAITAVHPMREEAVRAYLEKAHSDFSLIEQMIAEGSIIVSEYNGRKFYLRKPVAYKEE